MNLTKSDFRKDHFEAYISQFIKNDSLQKISLAYRLSRYALNDKRQMPMKAVVSLIEDLIDCKIKNNDFYILVSSLLLYYVLRNSYLVTFEDIKTMFDNPNQISKLVKKLISIEDIANSKTSLTKAKIENYKKSFTKKVIILKAAEIIGHLNTIDFDNEGSYFRKIHKRYLPILDIYKDIGDIVALKMRKIVFQKISYARRQSKKGIAVVYSDAADFLLIINDSRFKKLV